MGPENMFKQSQKWEKMEAVCAVSMGGHKGSYGFTPVWYGTAPVVCWCRQQLPSLLGKLRFAHRTILFTLGLYANHS